MRVSAEDFERLSAKTVRAYKHVDDLNAACDRVIESYRNVIVRNQDPQTREFVFQLRQLPAIPIEIPLIAGDVLNNLRSALDHIAVHFYSGPPTKVYFPFWNTAREYQSAKAAGKIQYLGKPLEDFFDQIKPYKGGNDRLWTVQKLNNIDKHRLLLTVATANYARSQTRIEAEKERKDWARIHPGQPFPLPEAARRTIPTGTPVQVLQAGHVFLRIPDSEVNEHPNLTIDVAINEVGIAEGEPLVVLMREIAHIVNMVIVKACE